MLSTLLSQVGTVLSKLFVFASFVPALVFAFVNGVLLYLWHPGFRAWVSPQISTTTAFYATAAIVGVAVVAYMLTMLSNSLRLVLEGRTYLLEWFFSDMRAQEQMRLEKIQGDYESARKQFFDITALRDDDTRLIDALALGETKTTNAYNSKSDPAAIELLKLRKKRLRNDEVRLEEADGAIAAFAKALAENKKFLHPGRPDLLDEHHRELLIVIDYAIAYWKAREIRAFNQRQFEFGNLAPEPTRMGNIAQSLQAYALARYNLNLESLWSGFFAALRSEKETLTAIEDAKAQLNFLVACVWLTVLSSAIWAIALVGFGGSVIWFLLVITAGPAVTYVFYRFSVESYGVFADVVRAALDHHRFCILDAMGLPVPMGLRDERAMWDALQELVGSGGKFLELSYRPRSKQETAP